MLLKIIIPYCNHVIQNQNFYELYSLFLYFKGRRGILKERQLTSFGAIVKKRLIELNKTQRWLADQVGINEKYLHLILYGDRSGETYVDSIMHALDLDPNKILKPA